MKNTIAFIICFHLLYLVNAQITGAEYFFDTDPGVGNGTSISVSGTIIDEDLNIPTTGLSEGIHKLYLRTENSDGSWSLHDQHVFYINPNQNNTASINNAEYFFDYDSGVGNGTSISVSGTIIDEDLNIPTTGLSEGIHKLYLRTENSDGSWSLYDKYVFYINPHQTNTALITEAEYFFDIDPGIGNGSSIELSDTVILDEDLDIAVPDDLPDGDHFLYLRLQNTDGTWSLYGVGENFTLSVASVLAKDFKLYPNPVQDKLHLETTFGSLQKIVIIDTNGKIIREYNSGSNILDMAQLNSGTYLIYIETEFDKISKKVIKK